MNIDPNNIPPHTLRAMGTKDRLRYTVGRITQLTDAKGMVTPEVLSYCAAIATRESDLQSDVSRWLSEWGYWPRAEKHISAEWKPKHGWQIHLHAAKKNPLLLDVLLLGNDGRYLEFELKRPGGKWSSKGQQTLCEHHGRARYETLEDAKVGVMAWEAAK